MLALFSTAFILFGAPALLLYAGRLIQSATDPAQRAAARLRPVLTGQEWFCTTPRPLFTQGAATTPAQVSEPLSHEPTRSELAGPDQEWFFRPMPPVIVWPDLRRFLRRSRRTASV